MHPKTYQVLLRQPFGYLGNAYLFHVHAQSAHEALNWAARVFEGINIQPTLDRWAAPATLVPRVGNNDPVAIMSCDRTTTKVREGRKFVSKAVPLGHFRKSEAQVAEDLFKVFKFLLEDRARLAKSFEFLKFCYERDGTAWYYDRLVGMKLALDQSLVWQANVWNEYLALQQRNEVILPERAVMVA